MQGLHRSILYVIMAIAAFCFLIALVFSNQRDDFVHSASFLDGLTRHGLAYYEQSKSVERLGGSDYLPGMYGLLQAAILPGQLLSSIVQLGRCTIYADTPVAPCLIEALSLKLSTVLLIVVWAVLLQRVFLVTFGKYNGDQGFRPLGLKQAMESSVYALFFPPILYSVILFGSYDGLGAFGTLIGGLLYFYASHLGIHRIWQQRFIRFAGLTLVSIGVGAKFFPLILLLGTCIAFAKQWKDLIVVTGIPLVVTIGQILVAEKAGGYPMRILGNKVMEHTSFLLYPRGVGIVLLAIYLLVLLIAYNASRKSGGGDQRTRIAVGSLASLGIFSTLFPSIHWHTQWQIYYGICLICSCAIVNPRGRVKTLLIALFALQALAFILITPFFADNADITMAFSMVRREVVPSLVHANILTGFQDQAIQAGWIGHGISQLLILAILTIYFLRSVKSRMHLAPMRVPVSLDREVYLVPGVVFLIAWYSLVLFSLLKTYS